MADNKLLLKRSSEEEILAEDDPLAELARLVGFEPAPAANVAQPVQRREPVFDLEDELLRELDIYAQPAAVETKTAVVPASVPVVELEPYVAPPVEAATYAFPLESAPEIEPAFEIEPQFEVETQLEAAPEPIRQPVLLEAVETVSVASDQHVYERPASHPVFDLEDEILREFSAFDARRVSHAEEHPVSAEVIHQAPPEVETVPTENVPVELHDVPDGRSTLASAIHGRDIYESFRDDDLEDAISNAPVPQAVEATAALVDFEAEPLASQASDVADQHEALAAIAPEPIVDDEYWADVGTDPAMEQEYGDDPVAVDFEPVAADVAPAAHADDAIEIATVPPAFVEPSVEEFLEQDDELVSQDFADAIPMTAVAAVPVAPAIAPGYNSVAQQPVQARDYGLDELLTEVEKYPVVDNTARWGVHSKPVAAEDVLRTTPPLVQDFAVPPVEMKAVDEAKPATEAIAPSIEMEADPAFDDSHFDIDLGEIELDLSDLNEGHISVSPELLADLAEVPVAVRDEPVTLRPARVVDADYSSLPFDPSQITQEEETFEAIAEMDVPESPVIHEEEKPTPHPEYDLDLDAEMAQLFVSAKAQSMTSFRVDQTTDTPISFDGVPAAGQQGGMDIDDFERALEEDFRRAFAENRSTSNPDRVSLAPVYEEPAQVQSRRRPVLLASAAVAIVLFGGAGVFAFMSGDTKMLTSSEPKVILADTEPVKVVPENPGGKQVPNEDKAVYDRVAGAKPDDTKQESLLTSNEEPLDVVQRTLMPESLPMDDDTLAAATPTGDTIDPRLLPDEEEQDRVSTTNRVVSGVSPRKVKTMVVRPDGTLVERDVTEEDLKQQATNDAELMKIAQKAAVDAATASDSSGDEIAKAIENVPERLAANDQTTAKSADVTSDTTARIESAEPDTTADSAAETQLPVVPPVDPVVIEDEKPANIAKTDVTTAEAKPEPVAVEEKPIEPANETKIEPVAEAPVERSIAVEQTADNADAVAKVANADVAGQDVVDAPVRKVKTTKITPVPEIRPVDQPVNVVGTVTDQGTVRSDTDAKTQEVAVADPVQKPAETTALPTGSYVIQIASLPSEAEAQTSYSRLASKFAGIIGGKGVDIRRAEIKNKGTYYRVRIPAGSKQEAQALCSQYKAAGGACLVSK